MQEMSPVVAQMVREGLSEVAAQQERFQRMMEETLARLQAPGPVPPPPQAPVPVPPWAPSTPVVKGRQEGGSGAPRGGDASAEMAARAAALAAAPRTPSASAGAASSALLPTLALGANAPSALSADAHRLRQPDAASGDGLLQLSFFPSGAAVDAHAYIRMVDNVLLSATLPYTAGDGTDRPAYHLLADVLRAGWANARTGAADPLALHRAVAKAFMIEQMISSHQLPPTRAYLKQWDDVEAARAARHEEPRDFVLNFNATAMLAVVGHNVLKDAKASKEVKASRDSEKKTKKGSPARLFCVVCGKRTHNRDACYTEHPELAPAALLAHFQTVRDSWVASGSKLFSPSGSAAAPAASK